MKSFLGTVILKIANALGGANLSFAVILVIDQDTEALQGGHAVKNLSSSFCTVRLLSYDFLDEKLCAHLKVSIIVIAMCCVIFLFSY